MRSTMLFGMSVLFLILFMVSACDSSGSGTQKTDGSNVFITDGNGRKWDVTHAEDIYGMQPAYFNFGIGVGAIPSVDNPRVLTEGDAEYPDEDEGLAIFGVDHNGEQRAYSVTDLGKHEVFNDTYPGTENRYVAVTF